MIGTNGETWGYIDRALRLGSRGLKGGISLRVLLAKHRGVTRRLTIRQVLAWADEHHRRTGKWPVVYEGPVHGATDGTSWLAIEKALRYGSRGFPGGTSLYRLLATRRGAERLPRLTVKQILKWADEHHKRTGEWPTARSGAAGAPKQTWSGIDKALRSGTRGVRRCGTLRELLARERGVIKSRSPLKPSFLRPVHDRSSSVSD